MMSSSSAGKSGFSRTARLEPGSGSPRISLLNFRREMAAPGRHLVKHRPERKQIGAGVQFLCSHLLRRHVGHRAQRGSRAGQIFSATAGSISVFCAAIWLAELVGIVTFANPKSRILACPRLVTKILAGLMSRWTMPSAWAASSASAISIASRQQCLRLQRAGPRSCASASCRPETPWR